MKLSPIIWLLSESILFNLLVSHSAEAQIVPDTTLPENSVVTIQENIIQIDGGTRAGDNLFHSFEQFSVPTDNTAFFNNAVNIQNILSRVTGNSMSEIDGIIKANPTANLFLINPNGIIFGPNASLDIGGSFLASTANRIIFADGSEFSTTATQTQPLLTISVPIGLEFGDTPASIVNRSLATDSIDEEIGLQVQPNQTLALVGGDVLIEGGFLTTEGGRIELGSVAGNNLVSLTPIDQGWALGYEGIQNFQDISLSQAAFVVSGGDISGDIQIQGRRVTLTEGSQVAVNALTEGQAGDLTVRASESVELEGNSTLLFNDVYGEATGAGSEEEATGAVSKLTVETERLVVKNGAQVSTETFGIGRGVDLKVSASEVELEGAFINADNGRSEPSGLFAQVREQATGKGGTLTIETERLIVQNGAQVSTETFGAGRGGDLVVNASESIELIGTIPGTTNPSGLLAGVGQKLTATGDGGDLTIDTGQLIVEYGAQIATTAQNSGSAGTLSINADSIRLSETSRLAEFRGKGRSGIFVSAEPALPDESGNLIITTADAGTLNLTARELTVEKGAIISADNFGIGEGASVTLKVDRLIIRDGGQIGAGSLLEQGAVDNERGSGGTLTVNASESVEVIGTGTIGSTGSTQVPSSLFTLAEGTGDAGNLIIKTENLNVRDGADVTVSSTGSGRAGEAGKLIVEADSIELDNNAALSATTLSGQGGDIRLENLDLLLLRRNSSISTQAGNEVTGGNGGNITIDTNNLVAQENSDIDANAFGGSGGEVTINAQAVFGTERREEQNDLTSDITASSDRPGLNGIVEINTPEVDPSQGLANLPDAPVNVEVTQGCQAAGEETSVEFFNTGRGGLAPNPYEPLSSNDIWEDVPLPTQGTENPAEKSTPASSVTPPDKIVVAKGWVFNEKGEVTLVAEMPSTRSQVGCRLN